MVSKSYSMGLWGMHAFLVEVETDISAGLRPLTSSVCRTPPSRNRATACGPR